MNERINNLSYIIYYITYTYVVDSLNYAYSHNGLSYEQSRGKITLIP